jgi:hypothetical protein
MVLLEGAQTRRNHKLVAGTSRAEHHAMAAVFALVFVPTLAAVLFMLGGLHGSMSFSSILATSVFVALATGSLVGLFRLVYEWDHEAPHS